MAEARDIVERLTELCEAIRGRGNLQVGIFMCNEAMIDAADEITRLRAEKRPWSDKLAGETIALQVKEIDRLHARIAALTAAPVALSLSVADDEERQ